MNGYLLLCTRTRGCTQLHRTDVYVDDHHNGRPPRAEYPQLSPATHIICKLVTHSPEQHLYILQHAHALHLTKRHSPSMAAHLHCTWYVTRSGSMCYLGSLPILTIFLNFDFHPFLPVGAEDGCLHNSCSRHFSGSCVLAAPCTCHHHGLQGVNVQEKTKKLRYTVLQSASYTIAL